MLGRRCTICLVRHASSAMIVRPTVVAVMLGSEVKPRPAPVAAAGRTRSPSPYFVFSRGALDTYTVLPILPSRCASCIPVRADRVRGRTRHGERVLLRDERMLGAVDVQVMAPVASAGDSGSASPATSPAPRARLSVPRRVAFGSAASARSAPMISVTFYF